MLGQLTNEPIIEQRLKDSAAIGRRLIVGNDDAGDFGIIQCNCDDYHAGIDCDFGCAPPNVFFDPEYHVGEQDSGELWACGHQVASSPSWLAEPTSRFEIRGYVPATAVERRLMCETPPCDQPTAGFAVW
jgi:hypothetical protein